MTGESHSHRQYLQSFMGIILFYTVNLYRNKVFANCVLIKIQDTALPSF